MNTYRIMDEPSPGTLGNMAVKPFFILLSLMLCGSWLAFPWFAFNAFALGCPYRIRTVVLSALSFIGAIILVYIVLISQAIGLIGRQGLPYAMLSLLAWKLGIGYYLYILQSTSFNLFEYYIIQPHQAEGRSGPRQYALLIVIFGMIFGRPSVLGLSDHLLWLVAVS